jgi:hypothetical protein
MMSLELIRRMLSTFQLITYFTHKDLDYEDGTCSAEIESLNAKIFSITDRLNWISVLEFKKLFT